MTRHEHQQHQEPLDTEIAAHQDRCQDACLEHDANHELDQAEQQQMTTASTTIQSADSAGRPRDHETRAGLLHELSLLNVHKTVGPNYGSFSCAPVVGVGVGKELKRTASDQEEAAATSGLEPHQKGPQQAHSWLERLAKRVPGLGILMALCASLFLGTAGLLVKMTHSVHGIQVAVFRASIQFVIYLVIICLRRLPLVPLDRRELWPVTGRAVLGAISITFSYYALKLIPLGDATTIRFSLPIWTLIVGYLLLGESCNPSKCLAVLISIAGVVLIAKPDDCIYLANWLLRSLDLETNEEFQVHYREHEAAKRHQEAELIELTSDIGDLADDYGQRQQPLTEPINGQPVAHIVASANATSQLGGRPTPEEARLQQLEGCLMALASSVCLSLSLISMRLCKRTPTEVIILWLSVCSILLGSISLVYLREWRLPNNWLDCLYILLNGLCGAIGQWFITSALKIEQSGIIALARTFDIEVAFLYSALLLHEHIRLTSLIGSVLVSSGVIIVVVPKWMSCSKSSTSDGTDGDQSAAAPENAVLHQQQHLQQLAAAVQQQQQQGAGHRTGQIFSRDNSLAKGGLAARLTSTSERR